MSRDELSVVLGGAGFLGSHLTEALVARGERVRVFDLQNADLVNLDEVPGDWEFLGGDFINTDDIREAVEGATTVYHLVSTTIPATSSRNPVYDVETNLVPTLHLLEAARAAGVRRIVFFSSGGTVYGRPQRLPIAEDHPTEPQVSYGVIKLAIEKYLEIYRRRHGLSYRVLRLANPYGPRQDPDGAQGAAAVFLGRAHAGEPIEIWGDGSVVRDYLYVGDAVKGILAAVSDAADDGIYNLGSGRGVSLNDLVAMIREVAGREVPVDYRPGRSFDVQENVLDIGKARAALGWEPGTGLREGLDLTWRWLDGGEQG